MPVNKTNRDPHLKNGLQNLKMSKTHNKVLFILSHFMLKWFNHSSWLKPCNFVGQCTHFSIYPIYIAADHGS
jgi:hypothetical protein